MTILTESAGHVLYEDGPRLVFINRGTGWTFWLRFVFGLVAFIFIMNGIAQVFLGASGQNWAFILAAVFLFFGLAAAAGFVATFRWANKRAARSLSSFEPIVIIDRHHHALLDARGNYLAQLTDVLFTKEFQFTSSAPALACRWPGGCAIVHRGGAMGLTGVEGAIEALRHRGLRA